MQIIRQKALLHSGQAQIWNTFKTAEPPKITVIAAGARWGKDRFCLQAMISLAQRMYITEHERRRAQRLVPPVLAWYIAPTFSLLRQSVDELKAIAAACRYIKINLSELRAYIGDAIQIEFKSADKPGSLLARGLDIAVMTEAARIKEDSFQQAILTRLSSPGRGFNGKGGLCILNSTPNGQNWFYDMYKKAQNNMSLQEPSERYMQAFHFTSYDSPLANKAELDRHRAILPDSVFRQEYLAEFTNKQGAVFHKLAEALEQYSYPVKERENHGLKYIGIDFGRRKDRTAIAVISKQGNEIRLLNFRLLKNCEYNTQISIISSICDMYPSAEVIPECNSLGDPLIAELKGAVCNKITPFYTSHTSKQNLIETVVSMFERQEIRLPADSAGAVKGEVKELFEELCAFEVVETGKSGLYGYSAPNGKHDDGVMAFCLAAAGKVRKGSNMGLIGVPASGF